jgi:hypothetical protein
VRSNGGLALAPPSLLIKGTAFPDLFISSSPDPVGVLIGSLLGGAFFFGACFAMVPMFRNWVVAKIQNSNAGKAGARTAK